MSDNERTEDAEPEVISGHNYDGIQEYDNPMPGWWVWMFVAGIVFMPIYILGVHVFGFIDTYQEDLSESQEEIRQIRDAWEEANPSFQITNEAIAAYVGDEEHIEAGAQIFATNCAMCHGKQGEGLIGPNLTDNYWLHGNQNTDLFQTITNGVLTAGMTPFENVLTPEQRAQAIAFIRSIHGSEPPNPKAPQGELYEDDGDNGHEAPTEENEQDDHS